MSLALAVQRISEQGVLPTDEDFGRWASAALADGQTDVELVIRIVDAEESRQLNRDYRGKDKATNVLSFPFEVPDGVPNSHIGDLVICAAVVAKEAVEQGKTPQAHWAHMVVHGILHLCGYDHLEEQQADEMETLERQTLERLGFNDPYAHD